MLQFLLNLAPRGPIYPLPTSPTFKIIWNFLFRLYFILFLRTPTPTTPTLADPTRTYIQEVPVLILYCVIVCVGFALCGVGIVFGRARDSAWCQADTQPLSMVASPQALVSDTSMAIVLYSPPAAPPTRDNTLPSPPCSLANEDEWLRIRTVVIFMGLLLMTAGEENHSGVVNTEEVVSSQVEDAQMDAVDDMSSLSPSNDALAPASPIAPNWAFPEKRESITLTEFVRVFTEAVGPRTPTPTFTSPAPSVLPTPPTPAPSIPAPSIPAPLIPAPPTPSPSTPAPSTPAPSTPAPPTPASLPVESPATDHAPPVTKVAERKTGSKVRARRTRAPRPGDWVSPRTESVSVDFVLGVAHGNLEYNAQLPLDAGLIGSLGSGKAPQVTPDWAFPKHRESITLEELARVHTEAVESWTPAPPTFTPPAPAPTPISIPIPSPTPPAPTPPIPTPPVAKVAKPLPGHKSRVRRTRVPRPGDWVSPRTESVSMAFVLGVSHENSKFNAELPLDAALFGTSAPPPSLPTPAATASALGRSTCSSRSRKPSQVVPDWAFPEKRESVTLKELAEEFM